MVRGPLHIATDLHTDIISITSLVKSIAIKIRLVVLSNSKPPQQASLNYLTVRKESRHLPVQWLLSNRKIQLFQQRILLGGGSYPEYGSRMPVR
jgi:hypothetical protein